MKAFFSLVRALRPSPLLLRTFALAFVWLSALRLVVAAHADTWLLSPLAVASDVAGAIMLSALLLLLRRGWPRWLMLLLLAMAFYAAGEHLAAHGTLFHLPHIIDALDPTFVGSVGGPDWGKLKFPLYFGLVWLLHWFHRRLTFRQPPRPRTDLRLEVAGLGLIAVYAVTVPSLTAPANNVVAAALAQAPLTAVGLGGPAEAEEVETVEGDVAERFFDQTRGKPGVDEPPNILVIMIEGLSAAYLPEIADYHGLRQPAVTLPDLEVGLEEHGFRLYRNVLSMQRKTNRGSYPMLCGEYPRLTSIEPKMKEVAKGQAPPTCAPEILARNGYFTSYQQAADLAYMGKARFMPRIGFHESLGARELAPDTEIEGWGLMDDVFFTKAGDRVLRLAEREEPWFATLLNVGTHHPFPQAPRVESAVEEWQEFDRGVAAGTAELGKKRQTSFSAMTQELLALLERLDDNGVFDDTLVVVTSDESGGFIEKADDVRETNLLAGNFGFMAVRPPAGMARDALRGRDELVGHIDLALTVADAAGIAEDDPGVDRMIGHSLFARDDDRERGLMLGNTYSGQTFFLLESGQLMVCAETLLRCDDWTFEPDRVIGSLQPEDDGELLDSETRNRLVERAGLIDDGARGE